MQNNLTILTLATFIQDLRSDLGIKYYPNFKTVHVNRS